MAQFELRAKIRGLMASGVLPTGPPLMEKLVPGQRGTPTRTFVSNPLEEPCTICGEPGPQVSYTYQGGTVVRLHAACDAMWQQERTQ
jgi:hypothetical protein